MKKVKEILLDRNYIFVLFFIFIIIYSLFVYKDFGISYDEGIEYTSSKVSAKRIYSALGILDKAPESVKKAQEIENYRDKYYGVAAQLPFVVLDYFPEICGSNTPAFWYMRHLYVRLMFILAGFCFYLILKDIIKSKPLLLLSLILFFFHPRISAHSFYNIKDSIFLSFFTISSYFLFKFIKNKKIGDLIVFSFVTAITINTRTMGILIPGYFAFWILTNLKKDFEENVNFAVIFVVFLVGFLYLIWPVLWGDPITAFGKVFKTFSKYSWGGSVVYNGELIKGRNVPATYIPVWILISSSHSHILVFILGLILTPIILFNFLKNRNYSYSFYVLLFSIYSIVASLGAVMIFHSTLYDDWRHLYYIYPSLLITGVLGLNFLLERKAKLFYPIVFCVVLSLIQTFIWMGKNHPHYYVYFNPIAGKNWDVKWDRDFWGLSAKQLIEKFIEKNDPPNADGKYLLLYNHAGRSNIKLFPPDVKDKFEFIEDYNKAQYIIGDYRTVMGDYPEHKYEGFEEYLNIKVDGKKIMTLFKRVDDNSKEEF